MDFQPLFRPIDYKVANGQDEINELLAKDYEPYGEPNFYMGSDTSEGYEREIPSVRQVMVKKEPYGADLYLNVLKHMLLIQLRMESVDDATDLFSKDELRKVLLDMGEKAEEVDAELAELYEDEED